MFEVIQFEVSGAWFPALEATSGSESDIPSIEKVMTDYFTGLSSLTKNGVGTA